MDGLYNKYTVTKTDGNAVDPNADYFVLRLDTDRAAQKAALRYADATPDKELQADLRRRVLIYSTRVIPPHFADLEIMFEAIGFRATDVYPAGDNYFYVSFGRTMTDVCLKQIRSHGMTIKPARGIGEDRWVVTFDAERIAADAGAAPTGEDGER